MYRHHQFSGDPHPGNFMLLDDGTVAFLDFGLFKVMPKELIELELACQRAGHEGDGERLHEIWAETGFLAHPDRFRPDKLLAQFRDATWWYVLDEEIELEPEIATQVMIDMSDPRSEHFGQMRHETLPADHLFGRRVEMLTLAVLSPAALRANFHRIAREWMYGDAAGDRARAAGGRLLRGAERSARLGAALRALAVVAAFALVASCGRPVGGARARAGSDDAGVLGAARRSCAISASLTVAFFPGPLLAGAAGLLFGTAARLPAQPAPPPCSARRWRS